MKNILLFSFFLFLASCQKQNVKKVAPKESHNAKNSVDYIGTYKGILPCADCSGLETEISINENTTFSIQTKYLGKGDKVFMQKGHFTWDKNGSIISLTDMKNAPNQYFVGEKTLTQLDMSGNKITGKLASEYILSKQPNDTSGIETVDDTKTTVDLNSRMATTTVIQKVNPSIGKFTLSETKWKLTSLNQKKVVQKGENIYFLKLNSKDGRFSAFSGCNNITGNYIMPSATTLSFTGIIATEMACANMQLESFFFTMLAEAHSYKLNKDTMAIFGKNKKQLAVFEASK